jgi:hypothetical protein
LGFTLLDQNAIFQIFKIRLGSIIVLIGQSNDIEATTVEVAVQRKWPKFGRELIQALDAALDPPVIQFPTVRKGKPFPI